MVISPRYDETKSDILAPLPNGLKCVTMTFRLPVVPHGLGRSPDKDKMAQYVEQYNAVRECLNFLGSAVRIKIGHAYDYIIRFNMITAAPDGDDRESIEDDDWDWMVDLLPDSFLSNNSLEDAHAPKALNNLAHLFDNSNADFVRGITAVKGVPLYDNDEPMQYNLGEWLSMVTTTQAQIDRFDRISTLCGGNPKAMLAMLYSGKTKQQETTPFLVESVIPRGVVIGLAAERNDGKSSLSRSLAVAVARGDREWLGFPIDQTIMKDRVVVYLYGEESEEEFNRSIFKLLKGGEWPEKLIAIRYEDGTIDDYLKQLAPYNVGLLIVDPARKFYKGDESSSDIATQFYSLLEAYLGVNKKCACIVALHLVDNARLRTLEDVYKAVRGSGVWKDRPRLFLCLLRSVDRTLLGIPAPGGKPAHKFGDRAFKGIIELGWDAEIEGHVLRDKVVVKETVDVDDAILERVWQAINHLVDDGKRVTRGGRSDGLFALKRPELKGLTRAVTRAAINQLIADKRLTIADDGGLRLYSGTDSSD
jgi:hypothetical protein